MNTIVPSFNTEITDLSVHLENIGKYTRKGIYWTKTFVSFDQDDHLKIRQLNLFQLLVRRLFGYYQNTTLEYVTKRWNEYQIRHGNVSPKLNEILTSYWLKRDPNYLSALPAETFTLGNSKIEEADVIGIAQLFSDPNNSKFCSNILSKHFKSGDIILVQGMDANRAAPSSSNFQTCLLAPPAEIQGWEPVGYEALQARVFESKASIENQLTLSTSLALRLLNNVNFLANPHQFKFTITKKEPSQEGYDETDTVQHPEMSQEEKELLWNELLRNSLENFFDAINKIKERFTQDETSTAPAIDLEEFGKKVNALMESQKDQEECTPIADAFKSIYTTYKEHLQQKKYTSNWLAIRDGFFNNTWNVRQKSLSHLIESYRQIGKRIFVCAEASLFFPNKGETDSEVMAALKKHKFTSVLNNIPENAAYYSFEALTKKYAIS